MAKIKAQLYLMLFFLIMFCSVGCILFSFESDGGSLEVIISDLYEADNRMVYFALTGPGMDPGNPSNHVATGSFMIYGGTGSSYAMMSNETAYLQDGYDYDLHLFIDMDNSGMMEPNAGDYGIDRKSIKIDGDTQIEISRKDLNINSRQSNVVVKVKDADMFNNLKAWLFIVQDGGNWQNAGDIYGGGEFMIYDGFGQVIATNGSGIMNLNPGINYQVYVLVDQNNDGFKNAGDQLNTIHTTQMMDNNFNGQTVELYGNDFSTW